MKNLTWQNPEQLFVAQELINKVKSKCCGIKVLLIHDLYSARTIRYSAIIYLAAKLSKLIIISSIISYKYVRFYGKRRPIGTNQTYFAYHNSILKCVGGGDKRGKRIGGEEDSLSSRCSIRSNSRASSRLSSWACY